MILKIKDICKNTAEKHNLSIDLIESVASAVFDELQDNMDNPLDIAYELPKFGTFNLRFKKFERYYESVQIKLSAGDPEVVQKRDNNPQWYSQVSTIYTKMQEYRKDKKEKRDLRNETKQSSKDNPTEHQEVHTGMDQIHPLQTLGEEVSV